jgi:LasA protease
MALNLKRKIVLAVMLLWVIPALACNFPTRNQQPDRLTDKELQQTLMAPFTETTPVEGLPTTGETPQPEPESELEPLIPPLLAPPTTNDAEMPRLVQPGDEQGARLSDSAFNYVAQSGDTLPAVARRFNVQPEQITSNSPLPAAGLIDPGQPLVIPNAISEELLYRGALLPDSEIVYSPSAADFDISAYIAQAGGYLSTYGEDIEGEWHTGAQIVERAAYETSTNPRILLSALEYQSGWVRGQPREPESRYPMGFVVSKYEGLYKQLILTQRQLTIGYYGWRTGSTTTLNFSGGPSARISPELNAGSAAVQYLFSVLFRQANWVRAIYGPDSFTSLHEQMFGDPWARAAFVEPMLPQGLTQPPLELPFTPGEPWNLTGGPHAAYGIGSAQGGLDFAPSRPVRGCTQSDAWVTASAPGTVVRSGRGVVVVDLDDDGREQTGWALFYLHIGPDDRAAVGTRVQTNDRLGHPSCEGGVSTGTHVHIARKYNGEWIAAGGPLPFELGGWIAQPGEKNYQGTLINGDRTVTAMPGGSSGSQIIR